VQAVQLVQRERQAEEEANAQRASSQAELTDAVAAALASRPQRRLWEEIYTISYSRYSFITPLRPAVCVLMIVLLLAAELQYSLLPLFHE